MVSFRSFIRQEDSEVIQNKICVYFPLEDNTLGSDSHAYSRGRKMIKNNLKKKNKKSDGLHPVLELMTGGIITFCQLSFVCGYVSCPVELVLPR